MSFVVLDTDVASGSLRGRLDDPLRARLTGKTWCISFVTVGELTKWTVLRPRLSHLVSRCLPCLAARPRGGPFLLHVLLQRLARKRPSPCWERALTCGN